MAPSAAKWACSAASETLLPTAELVVASIDQRNERPNAPPPVLKDASIEVLDAHGGTTSEPLSTTVGGSAAVGAPSGTDPRKKGSNPGEVASATALEASEIDEFSRIAVPVGSNTRS